jgi:phenylacetate-CoA ligase
MDILRYAYEHSPAILQDVAVTAAGAKVKWLKHTGRAYRDARLLFREMQSWTPEEIDHFQRRELARLLRHGVGRIPWFNEHVPASFADADEIAPETFRSLFPLLDKEDVRADMNRFSVPEAERRSGRILGTSGTTGTPLWIAVDTAGMRKNSGFFRGFLDLHGADDGDKAAVFAGQKICGGAEQPRRVWRRCPTMNSWLFSSYHIAESTIDQYIDALEQLRPAYIDGYPTALAPIASAIIERDRPLAAKPKFITTSSEVLHDWQREMIERAFGCPVRNQYGSVEMVATIYECPHGALHANACYGFMEVLDDHGEEVEPGAWGDLVATSFINSHMPLVRYQTGDRVKLGDERCPCGCACLVIAEIGGRTDDYLITSTGARVAAAAALVFKGVANIKQGQLVQHTRTDIEIHVVPAATYGPEDEATLVRNLTKVTGTGVEIRVVTTPAIERTGRGKQQTVVSHVTE